MNYRSVADLDDQIVNWLGRLPRGLEVIVGVPRSGMLVANLLSLHLNLPMTDVEGLLQGRMIQTGGRIRRDDLQTILAQPRKVLVVDDSVLDGTQMGIVKDQIRTSGLSHEVLYAAAYIAPGTEVLVDYFAEVVPIPRCFEWNLMHHKLFLSNSCMDIDGVLCRDPDESENDDGAKYQCFLADADPLYLPTHPVGWLVTSRLEKYRAATEAWLSRHGVQYNELIMMNYPDMAARRAAKAYASFKADVYLRTRASLFIESSLPLSRQIAELTGYHVFCMDTREMIAPGASSSRKRKILDSPRTVSGQVSATLKRAIRIPGGAWRRFNRLLSQP
jgi:orotate phosphoribosyltransferase